MEVTIQWTPRSVASIVRILTGIHPNTQQVIRTFKSVSVADLHRKKEKKWAHVSYSALPNFSNFIISWVLGGTMLKHRVSAQS